MALHDQGYNCAQAVLCAFADELGVDPIMLFKAAEGFGLGMGGTDCTCGALSGAVMAAGFLNSAGVPGSKADTYKLSRALVSHFEEKCGATRCKDLKGSKTGTVLCSCQTCIENGAACVEEVLLKKQDS